MIKIMIGRFIVIQISNEIGYSTGIMSRKTYNELEELEE